LDWMIVFPAALPGRIEAWSPLEDLV